MLWDGDGKTSNPLSPPRVGSEVVALGYKSNHWFNPSQSCTGKQVIPSPRNRKSGHDIFVTDFLCQSKTKTRYILVPTYFKVTELEEEQSWSSVCLHVYSWFQVLSSPTQEFWFKTPVQRAATQAFQSQNTTSTAVSSRGLRLSESFSPLWSVPKSVLRPVLFCGIPMEMLMTANSEWHNLGLCFSIHLILESQCQLHLRTENSRFITSLHWPCRLQGKRTKALYVKMWMKSSVWCDNRQYDTRRHEEKGIKHVVKANSVAK